MEEYQLYNRDTNFLNYPPHLVENIQMFNKYKLEATLAQENNTEKVYKIKNKEERKNDFSQISNLMEEYLLR